MDHRLISVAFIYSSIHLISGDKHTLHYFYTAVSSGENYAAAGYVDGQQTESYDNKQKMMIPKREWMKKCVGDGGYWDKQTRAAQSHQEMLKDILSAVMQNFSQTEGVHTLQMMYGCELDDNRTETQSGHFTYEGEEFFGLDLHESTWKGNNPKAAFLKQKLESSDDYRNVKAFLEDECIDRLQKFVNCSRSSQDIRDRYRSSSLVCHATYFPKLVKVFWQKNGQEDHEEFIETKQLDDGTFQKISFLNVSPEDIKKNNYTYVIQHISQRTKRSSEPRDLNELFNKKSSLMCRATGEFYKNVAVRWQKNGQYVKSEELSDDETSQKRIILTVSAEELKKNKYSCVIEHSPEVLNGGGSHGLIIGAVVAVLLLVLIGCVVFLIWKKKSDYKPANQTLFIPLKTDDVTRPEDPVYVVNNEGDEGSERKGLQRVVKTGQHVIGANLPATEPLHCSRCLYRAHTILKNSSHPNHKLFTLFTSGENLF